jgi:hypothetical protein
VTAPLTIACDGNGLPFNEVLERRTHNHKNAAKKTPAGFNPTGVFTVTAEFSLLTFRRYPSCASIMFFAGLPPFFLQSLKVFGWIESELHLPLSDDGAEKPCVFCISQVSNFKRSPNQLNKNTEGCNDDKKDCSK